MKFKTPDPVTGRKFIFEVIDVQQRSGDRGDYETACMRIVEPELSVFRGLGLLSLTVVTNNVTTSNLISIMAAAKRKDLQATEDLVGLQFPGHLEHRMSSQGHIWYFVRPEVDQKWLNDYLGELVEESAERCPNCNCVLEEHEQ